MVRPENKLSHVVQLQRMKQDSGQTVAKFSANIRAVARRCQFQVTCECAKIVSYEDHMVLYQLLSGLEDAEVQADLLAKADLTLAEAEKHAIAREMARRSQITVQQGHEEIGRLKSAYKAQKSAQPEASSPIALCKHCGEPAHKNRRRECKAFGLTCTCGRRGHLPKVCFNKGKPRTSPQEKHEAITDAGVYELATRYVIAPQRGYIDLITRPPNNRLPITVSVDVQSLTRLRAKPASSTEHTMSCTAVADTGATVTCGGPDILAALGVRRTDLMPSNIQLFAANKSRLEVLGVLPVSLALTADSGRQQVTDMLHIVRELSGMYLSRDVLTSLGSIPPSFPVKC